MTIKREHSMFFSSTRANLIVEGQAVADRRNITTTIFSIDTNLAVITIRGSCEENELSSVGNLAITTCGTG